MRTLTLQQWIVRNWFANLINGGRRYEVSGALAFEMLHYSFEHDFAAMRKAICEVDAEFPWRDDLHPDITFESIGYLSNGNVVLHKYAKPLKMVWFTIHPKWGNLRKSQVYAYERYLAKIAEELAKRFVDEVREVRSVIEVRSGTSFSV